MSNKAKPQTRCSVALMLIDMAAKDPYACEAFDEWSRTMPGAEFYDEYGRLSQSMSPRAASHLAKELGYEVSPAAMRNHRCQMTGVYYQKGCACTPADITRWIRDAEQAQFEGDAA